jgi:hypothetical protein
MFARPADPDLATTRDLQPQRKCGNGEMVDIERWRPASGKEQPAAAAAAPPAVASTPAAPDVLQGSAIGLGFRDAGTADRR